MREASYVNPGTPWRGQTAFCLASGYSLARVAPDQWARLAHRQHCGGIVTIAVNSSVKTARKGGLEPAALFFTDANWFEANYQIVESFPGLVFTLSRTAAERSSRAQRIENVHRPDFAIGMPPIKDGRSSGHRAVSLAICLGAARVVLLGYDMRIDPETGRSHCHDDYANTQSDLDYQREFLPSFLGWSAAAKAVGVAIVNGTPGSAIDEFERIDLNQELARCCQRS